MSISVDVTIFEDEAYYDVSLQSEQSIMVLALTLVEPELVPLNVSARRLRVILRLLDPLLQYTSPPHFT